jgi:hypothetical protein
LREHRRAEAQLRADESLCEVQLDDAPPFFERQVFRGEVDSATADVVDDDIDASNRPTRRHIRSRFFAVGKIGLQSRSSSAAGFDRGDRFAKLPVSRPTMTIRRPASAKPRAISSPTREPPVTSARDR